MQLAYKFHIFYMGHTGIGPWLWFPIHGRTGEKAQVGGTKVPECANFSKSAQILCEQLQAQVWLFSDLKNVPSVVSYLQLQIVHCLRGNHKHLQPVCFDILLQHLAYPNLGYLYSLPIVNFSHSFIQFTLKSQHHHWCPAKQPHQRQLSD